MDMSSIFSSTRLNRRSFLKTAAATTGAATLGASQVACGGSSSNTTTVQFWDYWVSQAPWVDNEIKLFEAAHPNIKIKKTTNASTSYDNLFNLAVKSNKQPDVFMVTGTATPYNAQVQKGWWMPIDKWINDKWKNRFPEGTFHEGSNMFGGKIYTAPLSGSGAFLQLYLNTEVFQSAGLTNSDGSIKVPKTWDEVGSFADAITKKGNGQYYGLGFGESTGSIICAWVDLFVTAAGSPGGAFGSTGGTWRDGLDQRVGKYTLSSDRNYEDFINLFLNWKKKGYFYPDSLSNTDEIARVNFENGKFGMTIGGVWNEPEWTTHKFTNYHLTTLVGPQEKPKAYYYHTPGGQLWAVSAKSQHPEEAWAWFDWLYSEDAGKRWVQEYNEDLSAFPSLNDPAKIKFKPFAEYVEIAPMSLAGPDVSVHNPETSKVVFNTISPNFNDLMVGVWTGQLPNVKDALTDLQGRAQAAFEKSITQAQANGAKVSTDDWTFSDWDVTKDYVTKPRQA
jgi:ABC-type glycerol-3-phosphate transport system substrate-binding protein